MVLVQRELKNAYIGEEPKDYLCFTANTAGSKIMLRENGSPNSITLETSTDGRNWSTYTTFTTITLTNSGDTLFFRNASETDTGFSKNARNYYQFWMSGSIAGSGDINFLLNKNSTTSGASFIYLFSDCTSLTTSPKLPATILVDDCYNGMFKGCSNLTTTPELPATTLSSSCYNGMFYGCTSLTTPPELPATTLGTYCYISMFTGCTNLTKIPKLPATTLVDGCYYQMFSGCSKIKLNTYQTGEYQTAYRIPTTGTGTNATDALTNMFYNTGGAVGTPSINTTYYASNTVV